jgi:hypothetical protein
MMAACLAGQWLAVQAPLWGMRRWYRVSLRRPGSERSPGAVQFSIREIMILTAIIAVLLGLGRMFIQAEFLSWLPRRHGDILPILFVTLTAIITTLPLLCSLGLQRFSPIAVALSLALVVVATFVERPILMQIGAGNPPDLIWLLAAINGVQTFWIFVIGGLVRYAGYRLIREAQKS